MCIDVFASYSFLGNKKYPLFSTLKYCVQNGHQIERLGLAIDVPANLISTKNYTATLGHKVSIELTKYNQRPKIRFSKTTII